MIIKDRLVEHANRVKLTAVSGQADTYDVTKVTGEVVEQGTPVNAELLQRYEDTADYVESELPTALNSKVDKVTGKGLSVNDFTNTLKNKLDGIEPGAEVNKVTSVAGKTGAVTVTKSDVGLGDVENVAVSTLLNDKVDKSSIVDNLDNTSGTNVLSAKQGNILKGDITQLQADVTNASKLTKGKVNLDRIGVTTRGGVYFGSGASATYGGAVGLNAIATNGGAVGWNATTTYGGAVGNKASADSGGAVGYNTIATKGGAVGRDAKAHSIDGSAFGSGAVVPESEGETIRLGGNNSLSSLKSKVELTVTSDERDKADINNITNSLDFINRLTPITFKSNQRISYLTEEQKDSENYRKYGLADYDKQAHARGDKKGERQRVGLKAQEIQEALLDIYGTDNYANVVDDNFYDLEKKPTDVENQLTVAYSNLVPFLIGAIKELKAEVEELKNERDRS